MLGTNIIPVDAEKLCIDFDRTIPIGHAHATLNANEFLPQEVHAVLTGENVDAIVPDLTKRQLIITTVDSVIRHEVLRNPDDMRDLIRAALNAGKDVAIISFTKFPDVIPRALRNLGLNDNEVSRIYIRGDFPGSTDIMDLNSGNPNRGDRKRDHILDAMRHGNIPLNVENVEDRKKVLLIDDDYKNIVQAESMNCQAIYLNVSNPYNAPDAKQYIGVAFDKLGLNRPLHLQERPASPTPPYVGTPISSGTPYENDPQEVPASTPVAPADLQSALARAQQAASDPKHRHLLTTQHDLHRNEGKSVAVSTGGQPAVVQKDDKKKTNRPE